MAKKDKAARAKRHQKRSAERSAKRKVKVKEKKTRQRKFEYTELLPRLKEREPRPSRKQPHDVESALNFEPPVPLDPKVAEARKNSYLMVIRRKSLAAADALSTLDYNKQYIVRVSYSGPRYHHDSDVNAPVRMVFVGDTDYVLSALARAGRHGVLSRVHIRRPRKKIANRPLWESDKLTSVHGIKKTKGTGVPIPRALMRAARNKAESMTKKNAKALLMVLRETRLLPDRQDEAMLAALREKLGPGADDD